MENAYFRDVNNNKSESHRGAFKTQQVYIHKLCKSDGNICWKLAINNRELNCICLKDYARFWVALIAANLLTYEGKLTR